MTLTSVDAWVNLITNLIRVADQNLEQMQSRRLLSFSFFLNQEVSR
jgi:hypothetical protein